MPQHITAFVCLLLCAATAAQQQTCEELALNPNSAGVCGNSQPCSSSLTFEDAEPICQAWGMRLCSQQEIGDGVPDFGCPYFQHVWTSDRCSLPTKKTPQQVKTVTPPRPSRRGRVPSSKQSETRLFNVNSGTGSTIIVSHQDNLEISLNGGTPFFLAQGEIYTLPAPVATGDYLTAQGPAGCFAAYTHSEWIPEAWQGTTFYNGASRYNPQSITVLALDAPAQVNILVAGQATPNATAVSIPAGNTHTFSGLWLENSAIGVHSDSPILAAYSGNNNGGDFTPLLPASNHWVGVASTSANIANSGTSLVSYSMKYSDGRQPTTHSVNPGKFKSLSGSQFYTDITYEVETESELLSVVSVGDGNGGDCATWGRPQFFSSQFIIPISAAYFSFSGLSNGYLTIVHNNDLTDTTTVMVENGNNGAGPSKGYYTNPAGGYIPAGTMVFSSVPGWAVIDPWFQDEMILLGAPAGTMPEPLPSTSPSTSFSSTNSASVSTSFSSSNTPSQTPSPSLTPHDEADIYRVYQVGSNLRNEPTFVVAYTSLTLYHNGELVGPMTEGQQVTIGNIVGGDMLHAVGPEGCFAAYTGNSDRAIEWIPESFAGTEFAFPATRYNPQVLTVRAMDTDTRVEITVAGQATPNATTTMVPAHTVHSFNNLWLVERSVSITALDGPILVFSETNYGYSDLTPIVPADTILFGVPSQGAYVAGYGADPVDYEVTCSDGNVWVDQVLPGQYNSISGPAQYEGRACSVETIGSGKLGVLSSADADGTDSATWLPAALMSTEFIVPVDAEFFSLVTIEPGYFTVVHNNDITDTTTVMITTLAPGDDHHKHYCDTPSKGYYVDPSGIIPAGTKIFSSERGLAVFDPIGDQETAIFGPRTPLMLAPSVSPSTTISVTPTASLTMSTSFSVTASQTSQSTLTPTPSPSPRDDVYRVYNVNSGDRSTRIVANLDGVDVEYNGVPVVSGMSKGEVFYLDGTVGTGDVISAIGLPGCFAAYSVGAGQEREWLPIRLSGTRFTHTPYRDPPQTITVYAPVGTRDQVYPATVTLSIATGTLGTATIAEGDTHTFTIDDTQLVYESDSWNLESDAFVLVSAVSATGFTSDFTPLLPADTVAYGVSSNVAFVSPFGPNDLEVTITTSRGSVTTRTIAAFSSHVIWGTGSAYSGWASKLESVNGVEFSVSSFADGTGSDGTTWGTDNQFSSEFVLPSPASFLSLVSNNPGVVHVYKDGVRVTSFRITADVDGTGVYQGYVARPLEEGTLVVSSVPAWSVFNSEPTGDEATAFGAYVVNECSINNGGCEHLCVDELQGFRCECNEGFAVSGPESNQCTEMVGVVVAYGEDTLCVAPSDLYRVRCCAVSQCQSHPCVDGTPAVGQDGGCACLCDPGFGGDLCDRCDSDHYGENCELLCEDEACGGDPNANALYEQIIGVQDRVNSLSFQQATLVRNAILSQTSTEQRVRAEGGSGLTHVRQVVQMGEQPQTWSQDVGFGFMNMHDHSNNRYTVGLAELAVVLNGVEFWTRHNDYGLAQPSKTSTDYHATEPLQFPSVPPSVLNQPTIADQITEMREYFRAFKNQDPSIREYRPYFRPVVTYMEGAWILDTDTLNRPFDSDRHEIEASTWAELHTKTRFLLNSGAKNINENIPYLPSCVREIINGTEPVYANWEYRIVNHVIDGDLPTDRFHLAGDNSALFQVTNFPTTTENLLNSRRARFTLNARNQSEPADTRRYDHLFLDEIMEQIPGKDNYGSVLHDNGVTQNGVTLTLTDYNNNGELNTAYYSRVYREAEADAVGRTIRKRSFHDPNVFAAMTSHEKVSGLENEQGVRQRWTYAIPLEIVYITPLTHWNPYGIEYKEDAEADEVTAGMRDGSFDNPYDGTRRNIFYRTPSEFFSGETPDSDAADTDQGAVWVLDSSGEKRAVRASGHWVFFPEIAGVGSVRQRWPIAPLHHENHPAWKELKATTALDSLGPTDALCFLLTQGSSNHEHELCISAAEAAAAVAGTIIRGVSSTLGGAHTHEVDVAYNAGTGKYYSSYMTLEHGHGFEPVP